MQIYGIYVFLNNYIYLIMHKHLGQSMSNQNSSIRLYHDNPSNQTQWEVGAI